MFLMLLSVIFGPFSFWHNGKWNGAKFSEHQSYFALLSWILAAYKKRKKQKTKKVGGRGKVIFCAVFCQILPKIGCDCFHMQCIFYLDELISQRMRPFCRKWSYLKKWNICVFYTWTINEQLTLCSDPETFREKAVQILQTVLLLCLKIFLKDY